jgi:hypothetical protein
MTTILKSLSPSPLNGKQNMLRCLLKTRNAKLILFNNLGQVRLGVPYFCTHGFEAYIEAQRVIFARYRIPERGPA